MKIEQAYVSQVLEKYFGREFREMWNLEKYQDPNRPAVFLGLYNDEDISTFLSNKSFRVFIMGGSDIKENTLLKLKKIINDGRSFTWMYPGKISNVLSQYSIPHKPIYIALKNYSKFTPVTLGDKIYVYCGVQTKKLNYYKWDEVVKPIISHFGENRVIFTQGQTIDYLIKTVYPQSFVYVKPNERGGNTTMWEMGHMGIRTLGKGHANLPNFTEYKDISHLISLICEEEKYIGKVRNDVSDGLQKMFIGPEWLNLSFWK